MTVFFCRIEGGTTEISY